MNISKLNPCKYSYIQNLKKNISFEGTKKHSIISDSDAVCFKNFCSGNLAESKIVPLKNDVLEINKSEKNNDLSSEKKFEKLITTGERFTKAEYENLSESDKDYFRRRCNFKITDSALDNIEAGKLLKKHLDKEYGENNYLFISLGTSPAAIAKYFEFSGIETKYLPMSNLNKFNISRLFLMPKAMEAYKIFLEKANLSKKDIESSDKNYLIFDYTNTGESLANFRMLMEKGFKIYSDKNNIHYLSLNDYLNKCESTSKGFIEDYITIYLDCSKAEDFGGVAHLPCPYIGNAEKIKDKGNTQTSNLYNFIMIDEV